MPKPMRVFRSFSIFAIPFSLLLFSAPQAKAVNINITYDSSVSSAPAGFKNAINYVAQTFDSYFTNPINVNINVGWGEINNGTALKANAVGESDSNYYNVSTLYNTTANDLYATDSAANNSTVAQTAAQHIPATFPSTTNTLYISSADAKAIGLAANSTASDGSVGFSSSYNYSFNTTGPTPANTYGFVGLAEHEISEILGRTAMLSLSSGAIANTPVDLFRYTAPGALDLSSPSSANYFSVDGGATSINTFNTISGADYGDWAGATADAFNAYIGAPGVTEPFTTADLSVLNAIGWQTSNATYTTVAALSAASTGVPAPLSTALLAIGLAGCALGASRKFRRLSPSPA